MKKIYNGWIRLISNGEEDYLLAVPYADKNKELDTWNEEDMFLAALVNQHMREHGQYLSVQYWTMDVPVENDKVKDAFIEEFYGVGKAKYNMHYSEDTGYLWTDEDLMVGGHDLLEELKSHVGKWLYMEINYSKEPKPK